MQFKRWRLVPGPSLVNAGLGLGLFFLASCGSGGDEQPSAMPETPQTGADILTLPAVWSTSELEGRVHDLALAGGAASTLAVVYEERGVELFNLDAERIAPAAPLAIRDVSEGAYVDFGGAALTVFPAVSAEGTLVAIVYGEGLVGPQQIDLPIEPVGEVLGLCSIRSTQRNTGVLDLAYWTSTDWENLTLGELSVENDNFVWTQIDTIPRPDGACALLSNGTAVFSDASGQIAALERPAATYIATLADTGALAARPDGGNSQPLGLRDGITVRAPIRPTAIAALGVPLGGGYPEGLIVLSGADGYRDRVTFVDAGGLSALSE